MLKIAHVTQINAKTEEQHTIFALLFTIKYLLAKNSKINIKPTKKILKGSSETTKFVVLKNEDIKDIISNPKPQTLSKNPKNGITITKKVHANKNGYKTENIGMISKFAKIDKKLKSEYIISIKGKTPICALKETANDSAINFGRILLPTLERSG